MISIQKEVCMKSILYAVQISLFHSDLNTANKSFIPILFLKCHDNGVVLLPWQIN